MRALRENNDQIGAAHRVADHHGGGLIQIDDDKERLEFRFSIIVDDTILRRVSKEDEHLAPTP